MNRSEINKRLGLSEEEMDAIGNSYENDEWDASSFNKVYVGRPSLGDSVTKTVTFKLPAQELFEVETKASNLGLSRSQYLRNLIAQDLKLTI